MTLEEPKVEYVSIEMADVVTASDKCEEGTEQGSGVESCVGPTAPSNTCSSSFM